MDKHKIDAQAFEELRSISSNAACDFKEWMDRYAYEVSKGFVVGVIVGRIVGVIDACNIVAKCCCEMKAIFENGEEDEF